MSSGYRHGSVQPWAVHIGNITARVCSLRDTHGDSPTAHDRHGRARRKNIPTRLPHVANSQSEERTSDASRQENVLWAVSIKGFFSGLGRRGVAPALAHEHVSRAWSCLVLPGLAWVRRAADVLAGFWKVFIRAASGHGDQVQVHVPVQYAATHVARCSTCLAPRPGSRSCGGNMLLLSTRRRVRGSQGV